MSKIANFPVLVFTQDRTFRIEGEFNSTHKASKDNTFINGKGYLDNVDEHAWIYCTEKPRDPNQYPYFWIENNEYVKSEPTADIYKQFRLNKFVSYSTERILQSVAESDNSEPLYIDEVINDFSASSEIFHPVLYTKDDFLKKITKTVINDLNISLAKYKYKMTQKYMISNMKSALLSPTKMSTMYFNAWAEMLGLKITVIIESENSAEDKLAEPYVYLSERDSVFKLSDLGPNFKFPEIPNKDNDE
jgi:hypothetical protein